MSQISDQIIFSFLFLLKSLLILLDFSFYPGNFLFGVNRYCKQEGSKPKCQAVEKNLEQQLFDLRPQEFLLDERLPAFCYISFNHIIPFKPVHKNPVEGIVNQAEKEEREEKNGKKSNKKWHRFCEFILQFYIHTPRLF